MPRACDSAATAGDGRFARSIASLRSMAAAASGPSSPPSALIRLPLPAPHLPAGRHVTVMAAAQLQPAPLALCGVELLGALDLPPSQHMTQQLPLAASPKQLQPYFALPVDGDSGSCLQAPASAVGADTSSSSSSSNSGSSSASSSLGTAKPSWQLQLDGSYPLLAVQLLATPQTNGSPGGQFAGRRWRPCCRVDRQWRRSTCSAGAACASACCVCASGGLCTAV